MSSHEQLPLQGEPRKSKGDLRHEASMKRIRAMVEALRAKLYPKGGK